MRWIAALLSAALTTGAAAQPQNRQATERELFRRIVEIPTVAGRTAEFKRLTALLTAEFRKAGITNVVVKDHDGTQTLIARWPAARPSSKKPILLMAHMDVVEANPSDWKNPPFQFREENGYYLGRGTNDNKAALTGIVLALQGLRASGFQPTRDLIVLFTGDEETTGNSARRAATEWRPLIDAEYALNGDAGGGAVYADGRVESFGMQIAEKTYADYKLTATNRGGHSSRPRPDNAIYALAHALGELERYRFPAMLNEATRASYAAQAEKDGGQLGELIKRYLADPSDQETADLLEGMDPGYTRTRCVATMLAGGHAPNALPQKAEATVNCRIFPGVSEVAREVHSEAPLAVLSGPTFAHEVAAGLPTAVTLACEDSALGASLAQALARPHFRPYLSTDVIGAEVGGAVKNVLAIACGVVEGQRLGQNARAALISRGFAEMTRFGLAKGARAETLAGLSGLGDLVLTCSSTSSRNFSLGKAIGEGQDASTLLANARTVAEGAFTAPVLQRAAQAINIDMPVVEAVCALLKVEVSVASAIGESPRLVEG